MPRAGATLISRTPPPTMTSQAMPFDGANPMQTRQLIMLMAKLLSGPRHCVVSSKLDHAHAMRRDWTAATPDDRQGPLSQTCPPRSPHRPSPSRCRLQRPIGPPVVLPPLHPRCCFPRDAPKAQLQLQARVARLRVPHPLPVLEPPVNSTFMMRLRQALSRATREVAWPPTQHTDRLAYWSAPYVSGRWRGSCSAAHTPCMRPTHPEIIKPTPNLPPSRPRSHKPQVPHHPRSHAYQQHAHFPPSPHTNTPS